MKLPIETIEHKLSRLATVIPELKSFLSVCECCGRACKINRFQGKGGFCRTPLSFTEPTIRYAAATLHYGEEPMLIGKGGSGTVFFTGCNLRCVFCQNYQISWEDFGKGVPVNELAQVFLSLQERGAENINLVTATHCIYGVLLAFWEAYKKGLSLPIVYNTNAYEQVSFLRYLEGIIDIYLPDIKFLDTRSAERYCCAPNYPEVAKAAICEMIRQVGAFDIEDEGCYKGVIIRHLILPDNLADTYGVLLWLKDEGFTEVPLSLMCQYTPQYRACEFPELCSTISQTEYEELVDYALHLGFENLLIQDFQSQKTYLPDFTQPEPFKHSLEF